MAEGHRGTVLLVEDQDSVRFVAERMLTNAGFDVLCCASAEDALTMLRKRADTIDVLLSDIYLEGMNGPSLAAEIRRLRPAVGVVLMSGYTEAEALDTGMVPGTRFLNKPYRQEELVAAVEAAQRTLGG